MGCNRLPAPPARTFPFHFFQDLALNLVKLVVKKLHTDQTPHQTDTVQKCYEM